MTKPIHGLLSILIIIASCSKGDIDLIPVVNIGSNIHNLAQLELSEFASNIRYVPLEPVVERPIGWTWSDINDFSKEYIVESDGKTCLLYDNSGRFIRQIGEEGRGPGEYRLIISVFLINEKIYVRDFFDLIEYNIDGTFIKRYKNGFSADGKYRFEESIMINDTMVFGNVENRTGNEEFVAFVINKNGDKVHSYENYTSFKLEPGVGHVKAPGKATIYRFGHEVSFKEFYSDTLFQLDELYRLRAAYVFDLGKNKEPFSKIGMRWDQKDLSSYLYLNYVYQTKDFLILNCNFNKLYTAKRLSPELIRTPSGKDYTQWYNYNGQQVLGIYYKRTGKLIFSKPTSTNNQLFTSGLYNDIDAGPRFFPDKMVNDSTMVMKIKFDHLVEHVRSEDFKKNYPKYPESKKRLELLVDSLLKAEFDNPVLMFVTFKR
jgi:mRNA-degrading endonuclease HigB of HigAB toxin-antitoxin module